MCVFTSLDCDQLDLNYYLLAEVAINLTTVNDGYGSVRSAGISNFVTHFITHVVVKSTRTANSLSLSLSQLQ